MVDVRGDVLRPPTLYYRSDRSVIRAYPTLLLPIGSIHVPGLVVLGDKENLSKNPSRLIRPCAVSVASLRPVSFRSTFVGESIRPEARPNLIAAIWERSETINPPIQ